MATAADLASGDRTSRGRVAGVRLVSVTGAEGVGAAAGVNNYALLTDSLKNRDNDTEN